jgi:uncharacterized protein (TIGR03435 family)
MFRPTGFRPTGFLPTGFILLILVNGSRMNAQAVFEVASVKPSNDLQNGLRGGCHGIDSKYDRGQADAPPLGRCVIADARLSHLIGIAWDVSMLNLKSESDWIARGNDRFNIEAKAEDPRTATEEQLLHMLQALLIDRFHLKFHRETVERPGFALVVGKKGSRLEPSTAKEFSFGPGGKPHGRPIVLSPRKCSMPMLAEMLSGYGPGPVVDKTGLPGDYDFKLSWDDKDGPSVFTALQDQLGLRLEPQKVSLSLFVVDSARKPDAN